MVSIIIINFNGLRRNFLPNCLHSLAKQTYTSLQIIVVDNASTDESVNYVVQNFPNILLIQNQENLGFCRGNNIGFENVAGDYILFVNNDTVLQENCIEQLLYAIELAPDIGMVAPKLIRPSFNSSIPQILDSAGLLLQKNFILRDRGFNEVDSGQYDEIAFLFAPCGAAAFFKREVLDATYHKCGELWDEDFVAYYEDGDLAWRVRHGGAKCLYFPEAVVTHHRGGSSASNFFQKPFDFKVHTIKNRYLMLIKNAPVKFILFHFVFLLRQEIMIWGYLLFYPRLLFAVLQALIDTIPSAIRKRNLIKPHTEEINLFAVEVASFTGFKI